MNFSSINNVIKEVFHYQDGRNLQSSPYGYQPNYMNQGVNMPQPSNNIYNNFSQPMINNQMVNYLAPMNINNLNRVGIHYTNLYYLDKIKNFLFKEIWPNMTKFDPIWPFQIITKMI